ncbi:MAG: hypothetical protein VXX39_02370 [Candidatus Thermoplasmatota archaeon]|nr:hypothetical protein [Candidatus Thermoplasmatota archaeon]
MEQSNKAKLIRGIIISASVYIVLFVGHIFAAANDFDLLFSLIAIAITLHTIFCGLVIIILSRLKSTEEKFFANKIGYVISIPLTIGLSRAYSGMEINNTVFAWLLLVLISHYLVSKGIDFFANR